MKQKQSNIGKKNKTVVNSTGTSVEKSREVNIMHMDAKPLMITFMVWGIIMFLLFTFLAGIGFYAINSLNQKIDAITTATTTVDNN